MLQNGRQSQKWPTSGPGGYITPAAGGVHNASKRGDKVRGGTQVGHVATEPLPPGGVPNALQHRTDISNGRKVGRVAT